MWGCRAERPVFLVPLGSQSCRDADKAKSYYQLGLSLYPFTARLDFKPMICSASFDAAVIMCS